MNENQPTPEMMLQVADFFDRYEESNVTIIPRCHPADVTAVRLLDHVEKWHDKMDGRELDALALVRFVLHEIADGER